MGNVYEVNAKKVITSTNTDCFEVEDGIDVENEEVSKKLGELVLEQMSPIRSNKVGETNTDMSVDVLPNNQKEGNFYFITRKNYNPDVIVNNTGRTYEPDDEVFMRNLEDYIDVPPETKSILYYSNHRHSRIFLPNEKLCFYFYIEKEKVVELWNKGKIDELMTHNIIPTNPNQINNQDVHWRRYKMIDNRNVVHPNHPCLLKEIYKKRKQKKIVVIVVFGKDEINLSKEDFSCLGNRDEEKYREREHFRWLYKLPEYDTTTFEKIESD